jgi:hypothetical protein
MLHELAHLMYRRHFLGFYKFNTVLLSGLIRDVEAGELRGRVDWRDVPREIAGVEEIFCTITGDLKKRFEVMFGGEKKDRYRYRL